MSYLDSTRLVFSGTFQADVSTVNNDVRHFDDATFESRFQKFQDSQAMNGWWNPIGSGAFRLVDCQIQSASYKDGTTAKKAEDDTAIGLYLSGSNTKVGGKLVDLDPQWQMASQVWGLEMRLSDDKGTDVLNSQFQEAPFRDLTFSRLQSSGDSGASAIFQSRLLSVDFLKDIDSRILKELQEESDQGALSVSFSTFGYNMNRSSDRFTFGTIIGVIGPYKAKEPYSCIAGRRFSPVKKSNRINYFDCVVENNNLIANLGNALPLSDPNGGLLDIGELYFGVLNSESTREGASVTEADFAKIGEKIPYQNKDWLITSAGIQQTALDNSLANSVKDKPLAVLKKESDSSYTVLIRENPDGLAARADNFVQRLEPGQTASIEIFATQYGKRLSNKGINVELMPKMSGMGGGPKEPNPPTAPIPDINVPANALSFAASSKTDENGTVRVPVKTADPKNPRNYIDGQIYLIQYQVDGLPITFRQSFDYISILLFDAYQVPETPTWTEHIQPILTQYGNLYPIMSQKLVNLGNYESVKRYRSMIELAVSLEVNNANYMPVTRDLSANKRTTLLKWLSAKNSDGSYSLPYGPQNKALNEVETTATTFSYEKNGENEGGKTLAAKQFHDSVKQNDQTAGDE